MLNTLLLVEVAAEVLVTSTELVEVAVVLVNS